MSHRYLQQLISRHITHWFHRVGTDELSPALSIAEFNDRILEYIHHRRLGITLPDHVFRQNMCEFLCTFYKASKQGITWSGPQSKQMRPKGWTSRHEMEWIEYLQYHHFSSEFWSNFWNALPEAMWETRTPRWRDSIQLIVLHYLAVVPTVIEFYEEGSDQEEAAYEEY
jgi:hypothetical protein